MKKVEQLVKRSAERGAIEAAVATLYALAADR